ncbi:MAG: hypothetical protein AVDCRST_MAG19-1670 [uncultured Thermomicrobiales bacterium]|uniref:PRC-barrel domain-containing protein n=1 Tax=uncultured Thermomicrobiales bacterium TaxID=1645740 RepID=A0A6J4UTA7_9BACT|nr:MAG: hypothetical protein AVDCRST_MAG19-1670 [uncultured Thermomicrobiales bacterium]
MVAKATGAPVKLKALADSDMTLADAAIDVRGRTVVDRTGEEIGTVDALMLDEAESKVRFLRVAAGGFLGLGERLFLIPVDAVTRLDENHVHVDQTRERVVGAPAYDPNIVPDTNDYAGLYGYYGYAPFWAPGYVYPAYPYYR